MARSKRQTGTGPAVSAFESVLGEELAELRSRKKRLTPQERQRLAALEQVERAARLADRDDMSSGRIYSRVYRAGYAENRNGFARFRFAGHSFSPGVRWQTGNETEIRSALEEWLDGIHTERREPDDVSNGEVASTSGPEMLSGAIAGFLDYVARVRSNPETEYLFKHRAVANYLNSINYFFGDVDLPLDVDAIRLHLVERIQNPPVRWENSSDDRPKEPLPPIGISSTLNYLKRVRQVMKWVVDQGWLPTNPAELKSEFEKLGRALRAFRKAQGVKILPTAFIEKVIAIEAEHDPEMSMYFELLWLTGARCSEGLDLWWFPPNDRCGYISWEYTDDALSIRPLSIQFWGKWDEPRSFPILNPQRLPPGSPIREWHQRLNDLIVRLWHLGPPPFPTKSRPPVDQNGRRLKVFRWAGVASADKQWTKIKNSLGENRPQYRFHAMRRARRRWFENVAHFSPDVMADLLGHSITVSENYYRHFPTAAMLANRMTGGQLVDNTSRSNGGDSSDFE